MYLNIMDTLFPSGSLTFYHNEHPMGVKCLHESSTFRDTTTLQVLLAVLFSFIYLCVTLPAYRSAL